jgi:hypothetical protein
MLEKKINSTARERERERERQEDIFFSLNFTIQIYSSLKEFFEIRDQIQSVPPGPKH